jgi:lantibiotic modifying enzyme
MLFAADAHEPLTGAAWKPAGVEAAIREIAREADEALRDRDWWPVHPLDAEDGTPDPVHGVYCGAAGVLLALARLAEAGRHEPGHAYPRLAEDVLESYLRRPEFGGPAPSAWLGEGGIALVAWLLARTPALPDRLARLVVVDPASDSLELLLGSPGLLRIADVLLEHSGEHRWATASSALAEHLMAQRGEREPGLWTQQLYGETEELLGAGHGFAGVVAALARHRPVPGVARVLAATAVREGAHANWPPRAGGPLADRGRAIRTQWCHGAPGMVASLSALPRDDEELDALLVAGGELTWAAGPLRKGASLCHGTAGNGFALLKLFTRTGDELWLERARRFATHSAAQVAAARDRYGHGRHSLWTGDLGTALFLQGCLEGTSALPALDRW